MKKVVLGSVMFLGGILSVAIMLAGAMAYPQYIGETLSAIKTIQMYGIMPFVYIFAVIALIGLGLAVFGLFEKKD